jgi:agmatine deiminase
MNTPVTLPRTVPHEAAPQRAIVTAWPAFAEYWLDALDGARAEFAQFLDTLSAPGADGRRLPLIIYAADAMKPKPTRASALGRFAEIVRAPYGDVWARDTGPVFVKTARWPESAVRFAFNGWGGKYELGGDETIGARDRARKRRAGQTLDLSAKAARWSLTAKAR